MFYVIPFKVHTYITYSCVSNIAEEVKMRKSEFSKLSNTNCPVKFKLQALKCSKMAQNSMWVGTPFLKRIKKETVWR